MKIYILSLFLSLFLCAFVRADDLSTPLDGSLHKNCWTQRCVKQLCYAFLDFTPPWKFSKIHPLDMALDTVYTPNYNRNGKLINKESKKDTNIHESGMNICLLLNSLFLCKKYVKPLNSNSPHAAQEGVTPVPSHIRSTGVQTTVRYDCEEEQLAVPERYSALYASERLLQNTSSDTEAGGVNNLAPLYSTLNDYGDSIEYEPFEQNEQYEEYEMTLKYNIYGCGDNKNHKSSCKRLDSINSFHRHHFLLNQYNKTDSILFNE